MSHQIPAFLDEMIDYAGTFPPASLAAEEALGQYHVHRSAPYQSIVGGLVWSAAQLTTLSDKLAVDDEVEIALIGRPSSDWSSWQAARADDKASIQAFSQACPACTIATYEWKLPSPNLIEDALRASKSMSKDSDVFVEVDWAIPCEDALAAIAESEWAFVKFRTGGTSSSAFPSSNQLATLLRLVIDLEVEFKLTAGLHEPVAHFDEALGVHVHGFLNVLLAISAIYHQEASHSEIVSILSATNEKEWLCSEDLSWGEFSANAEQLDDCRSFFRSFGSCSITEPVAGIARLGNK